MADLAVVALGLDASGMTSGAAQANRALTSVEGEMTKAERQSVQLGGALQKTGTSAQGFNQSISRSAQTLSGLSGPIGQVSGQLGGLSGQLEGLVSSFGLIGGAALGAVAGVAALGSELISLTLQGVKLSDEMGDIAEGTGLTIDQVQRLAAGMKLAGEDIGTVERSFRTFQGLIQEAIEEPSGKAAHTLERLGTDAKTASKDVGVAFLNISAHAKDLSQTVEGATAVNELFSRSSGAMKRSQDQLQQTLFSSRDVLEDAYIIGVNNAVDAGQKLDTQINKLSNTWDVFTQNLAQGKAGDLISAGLSSATGAVIAFGKSLDFIDKQISGSRYLSLLFGFGKIAINPFATIGQSANTANDTFGPPFTGFEGGRTSGGGTAGGGGGRGGGGRGRIGTSPNLPTSFDPIVSRGVQRAFDLINAMNDANAAAAKAARELPVVIDTIVEIFQRLGSPVFASGAAPPITSGGIPGVNIPAPLAPSQIISARQGRIEDALGGIFEDFVFQITSARSTVGDAFKGLLLGITDTFAAEFAKAMQESLRDAFIKPLAGWLEDALSSIFEGIDLKGVSKFFLTLGKSFVGAFAEGGTIPSGHWGLVGEKGPEIAFAGGSPMHIQPMGGGGSVTMNFAISTASGEVSQRTQDQIADAAARGIERASRIRGAR